MYPQRDLSRLSLQKAALQLSIASQRERCAEAASRAVRPLEWAGRVHSLWRRVSPALRIASMPLFVAVTRAVFPRSRILRTLVRWGPLAFAAAKAAAPAARAFARSGSGRV